MFRARVSAWSPDFLNYPPVPPCPNDSRKKTKSRVTWVTFEWPRHDHRSFAGSSDVTLELEDRSRQAQRPFQFASERFGPYGRLMCNLYTQSKSADEVVRLFRDLQMPLSFPEGIPNLEPTDIAITDAAPIVRQGQVLVMRRWSWPGPVGKPVYNFRSEGRDFVGGRCLILADGFYEFTAQTDPKVKRKHKWLFKLRSAPLFALAGLWRTDSKVGEAFTMLTTEPGDDVRPYHSRQVVVLRPEVFGRWLDPAVPAHEVLRPLPAGSLDVTQIC